jgi:hypothetical protein
MAGIDDLQKLVHLCGSFLTIREDYAYLIHQSVKDYLTTSALTRVFPDGAGPIHFDMFSRSLNTLPETLRLDIYDLRHPGPSVDDVKKSTRDLLAALGRGDGRSPTDA